MEEVESKVIAFVGGKPYKELPSDLFIPPDALEILLDSFTGPLDLLLYLIRRQNLDILNIPIALISKQYLHYISLMKEKRLELAADYLVMAAMLAEIKSRFLLPRVSSNEVEHEEDPRLALVKQLQRYEQFKEAAANLESLPHYERDYFHVKIAAKELQLIVNYPEVKLDELVKVMSHRLEKQSYQIEHQINKEPLSVREKMVMVLEKLQYKKIIIFTELLEDNEEKKGLIVNFLAILELARQVLIYINQTKAFAPIYLQGTPHDP